MKKLLSVFTLVLGILILFEYVNLEEKQKKHEETILRYKNEKADKMFEYIALKNTQAQLSANFIKTEIIRKFDKEYKGREDVLMQELDSILNGEETNSRALEIIGETIDGYSLNNIQGNAKDNNDPIIMLVNLIVGDLSYNCATDSRTRTIDVEKKNQFASKLAETALNDITKRGKTTTFWHFLPEPTDSIWYEDIKSMKDTDLLTLKKMYIKYDVNDEFLRGFEMLVVDRINSRTDYFGNRVITPSGVYTDGHYQIHIIQGYNILDQLQLDPKYASELKDKDTLLSNEKSQFITYKAQMHLQIIVTVLLFILLFLYVERRR